MSQPPPSARPQQLTSLPWRAPILHGQASTLMFQLEHMPPHLFPRFFREACHAHVAFLLRHPTARGQAVALTAAEGTAYPQEASRGHGVYSTLLDLDWNTILQTLFTRFAETSRTPCLGVPWTGDFVRIILQRHDLDTLVSFRAMYWQWVLQCPAAKTTVQGLHDARPLRHVCKPGAWLLDTVYTEILVIERLRPTTIIYEVVGNVELQHMAELILDPVYSRAVLDRGRNYVGNVMEHLAWLALEEGRDELVVAVAFYLMRFTFHR